MSHREMCEAILGLSACRQRLDKRFGAVQGVEFSDIEELEVVGKLASDIKPVAVLQIEVHDREAVGIGTHGFEETRRHDMDAAEGPSLAVGHTQICMGRPYLPSLHIGPSHEALPLAEEQIALGDAVADQQGSIRHRTVVEPGEIGVAQDIDVVDQHRAVGLKPMGSMTDATTRVEEFGGLVRDMYLHPEVVGVEIVDDLVGEVVHIDHDAGKALRLQFSDDVSQQRFPRHGHQCLGHSIGERLQAGAQPCREYHCLFCHVALSL